MSAVAVEQGFEDGILVRGDGSLHNVLVQAPGCINDNNVVKLGLGIEGKHNASAGSIRADHFLHTNREGHLRVIEALLSPVADRPIGKERGVALGAGLKQIVFSCNIEKCFLRETSSELKSANHRMKECLFAIVCFLVWMTGLISNANRVPPIRGGMKLVRDVLAFCRLPDGCVSFPSAHWCPKPWSMPRAWDNKAGFFPTYRTRAKQGRDKVSIRG